MKIDIQHPIDNTVKKFNHAKTVATYYINKYQDYLLLFISK